MADTVRRTIEFSTEAIEKLKEANPKQFGLTQFEYISFLIETADVDSPAFKKLINLYANNVNEKKRERKEHLKKLKKMSSEELQKVVLNAGK